MANSEQIELSSFIKNVHLNLRKDSRKLGANTAWENHCQNNEILQEYAKSMKKLATEFWEKNAENDNKVISRISWIYNNISEYFNDGLIKHRTREKEIIEKMDKIENEIFYSSNESTTIKVLDVGSCYNPFSVYKNLNVIPIDIAPSCDDVYKCDFLQVKISSENIINNNTITELNKCYFNVVIFSLFLEYLPSTEMRQLCCEKAYNLLDYEGLLIIVTPDSKHVGVNAKLMKSWRYILSKIGFCRIKYEKLPYLHCMLFRKSICKDFTQRWAKMHENDQLDNEIFIPQDFNDE